MVVGKLKDLTLTPHFGYLTVIERAENIGRYVAWKCKCKCGKELVVRAKDLTSGNTKSCGCYKIERLKELKTNGILGNRYNKLVVIEETEERNASKQRMIRCKCDCGSEVLVAYTSLITGNTKSCGCIKSHGEQQIAEILTENNVEFAREYTFKDFVLENGGRPRFDFAIFNEGKLSHLIEYDGIQHFEYTDSGWNTKENYEKTKANDKQKNEFCKRNNIRLIRIKYDEGIAIDKLL